MKRILLIEDNDDIRENLIEFLQLEKFEVFSAKCGADGILLALERKPDLIICDILMSEMDGFQVLHELSRVNNFCTPFIFSTSKSEKADRSQGMKLGATDFIVKPYQLGDLLDKINGCIDTH